MLRYLLLTLLAQRQRHGYGLKAAFEELLAGTWPLNVGQVYRELGRLEQDGLVASHVVAQTVHPDRKVYRLTRRGRKELAGWLGAPGAGLLKLRDDVFLKVALHLVVGEDAAGAVDRQRAAHLEAVAEVEGLRAAVEDEATALVLDGLLGRLEADLAWLDRCTARAAPPARSGGNSSSKRRAISSRTAE